MGVLKQFLFMFQPFILFMHLVEGGAEHRGGMHLQLQQAALLQWKSTLRNPPPELDSSWRTGTSPCSSNWTGVACGIVHHGRRRAPLMAVTGISLPSFGLDGRLGELNFSALPFLTFMDLSFNSLHGEIPLAITSLPMLSYLDLTDNWLHGSIPSEFGSMRRLTQLGFSGNNLTGRIPASLGNLTTLTDLVTQQNLLTGPVPGELGKLTNLKLLDLGNNF
jgi:Leucine-rich repeat (LRR) protein